MVKNTVKSRRRLAMDGNTAVAHVAHATNEVIAIYPITPSSVMGEVAEEKSSKGEKNIWGVIPAVVELQSEGGAAGAVHGSLSAGAITTTFTASQGLLLMLPNMYKIAGELTPTVFHVSARALAAQALSIFGDHSDVMSCRGTGWTMLVSNNPQEAMDMALIAQAITLKSRIPVLHFFDGFRTSHEIAMVEELTHDDMKHMIDDKLVIEHRKRALSPDHPTIKGTSQNPDVYFQGRESANNLYDAVPAIAEEIMDKFAKLTGRQYKAVDYYGDPKATDVMIALGSSADVAEETIDYLNANGSKCGLIKIRLLMPLDKKALANALPSTLKRIVVLDRTKEPGSNGEPLYQIIRTAIGEMMEDYITLKEYPMIIGGRYGLGSKDFTPSMVKAVFENLASKTPKKRFTVGIIDDLSGTSLDWDSKWTTPQEGVFNAMFFGLGSDGTVGANKNTAKIISDETNKNVQAYFVYDSKKAGSMTTSHIRFGDHKIKSSYLIQSADFIACHNYSFLEHYNILAQLKKGGTFLLNSHYSAKEVWDKLPENVKAQIIATEARFYVIDAVEIGKRLGLGARINMILQAAFFKISNIIEVATAKASIENAIKKTYGKFGDSVVKMNIDAMNEGFDKAVLVEYPGKVTKPDTSKIAKVIPFPINNRCKTSKEATPFIRDTVSMLVANEGDNVKVSQMPNDGTWPVGTARFEKRNIAENIPVWDSELCIQCAICSFVCPHSAVRMKYYDAAELKNAPKTFKSADARGKEFAGKKATIQIAPEDCTGCGACAHNCPAISKTDPKHKALNMQLQEPLRESESENFEFFIKLPELPVESYNKANLKGSQLAPHHFEFSGACAGCGETPYIKLVTQLFGDRMIIANATGCSSIYGGNLPTTPYCTRADGKGPAWSNSLFEDNAEFGYGMKLATNYQKHLAELMLSNNDLKLDPTLIKSILEAPSANQAEIEAKRAKVEELKKALIKSNSEEAKNLLAVIDNLVEKSIWIIGGDGWAYDIGFGGLDHVIASGLNVNILVLDTEVYSNTGGQASKSTPMGASAKYATNGKIQVKKDLALMATTYGSAYVAKVSLSNPAQCAKAFIEAESYNGPSIIIANSHCIAHGINMTKGVDEQKKQVQIGYWPLYRFDPRLTAEGKNPFQLDSKDPNGSLEEFMNGQNRFRITKKHDGKLYSELVEKAELDLKRKFNMLKELSATPETDK